MKVKWSFFRPGISLMVLAVAVPVMMVCSSARAASDSGFNREAVFAAMRQVADWQLAHPSPDDPLRWTQAALYVGMVEWGQLSPDPKYLEAMKKIGEEQHWELGKRIYHADDQCVGQLYLELYRKYKDPAMIKPLRERYDYILAHPSTVTLLYGQQNKMDRWWWCDSLFMAPPVWCELASVTGDQRYLDFMDREWWATTDFLYDKQEHLYFRDNRYFDKKEANGKKVFWSRGNGWVIAGLARVLDFLPKDQINRPKYEKLFQELAARIAELQPKDGLWRASLLDPDSYPAPETSGSGFFCYALAWGINHGLLDREKYLPVVERAWSGLLRHVSPAGKLGYVQPVGSDPKKVTENDTAPYGVGAFLLAGTQVAQLGETVKQETDNP